VGRSPSEGGTRGITKKKRLQFGVAKRVHTKSKAGGPAEVRTGYNPSDGGGKSGGKPASENLLHTVPEKNQASANVGGEG